MAAETQPTNTRGLNPAGVKISTFVFLDFESTNLLERKCRITELCLLAINRLDMEEAGTVPRVTNKLTLCLDPKMPISMTSSNITGLFNDSLENQKAFTAETVTLINAFLTHLSKPICLLAHNGNKFDFPLLVAELKRINQSLDESLFCADTLEAFRSLDGLPANFDQSTNQNSFYKIQNSQMKVSITCTPTKATTPNTQSPLKRKGSMDYEAIHSPKLSRQGTDGETVSNKTKLSVEKVKKKLDYGEQGTDLKIEKEISEQNEENSDEKEDSAELFSGSLDDSDYLIALEEVENDLCSESLVLGGKLQNSKRVLDENEKVSEVSSKKGEAVTVTGAEPSCVENGTGYYVTDRADYLPNHKKHTSETENLKASGDFSEIEVRAGCLEGENGAYSSSKLKTSVTEATPSTSTNVIVSSCDIKQEPNQSQSGVIEKAASPVPTVSSSEAAVNSTKADSNLAVEMPGQGSASALETSSVSSKKASVSLLKCSNAEASFASAIRTLVTSGSSSLASKFIPKSLSSSSNGSPLATGTTRSNGSPLATGAIRSNGSPLATGAIRSNGSTLATGTTRSNGSPLVTGAIRSNESPLATGTTRSNESPFLPCITRSNGSPLTTSSIRSNGSPVATQSAAGFAALPRQSYKLEQLHLRKFGHKPLLSHKAEDDCVTLLKVAKCTPDFMDWVDRNAVLLSTIPAPF